MSSDFNSNTDNNPTWLTPPYILDSLGSFDLDPCTPEFMPWKTADRRYFLPDTDGLTAPWEGRVWLNPPYGSETFKWLDKLSKHKDGIALIFARTETIGFHDTIWSKAHAVFFFKGRLKFFKEDGSPGGTANAPSCLVSYSESNTIAIDNAHRLGKLKGTLVLLGNKVGG